MVKATGLEYPSYIKRYPWLKLGTVHDLGILVPYFDMLNHSEDSNASYYYDPETDSLIVDVIEAWFRKFSDFLKYFLIDYTDIKYYIIYFWNPTSLDILSGQQVFINYGSRSDDRLLQNYGFILPKNMNTLTKITLDVNEFENAYTKVLGLTEDDYWQAISKQKIKSSKQIYIIYK